MLDRGTIIRALSVCLIAALPGCDARNSISEPLNRSYADAPSVGRALLADTSDALLDYDQVPEDSIVAIGKRLSHDPQIKVWMDIQRGLGVRARGLGVTRAMQTEAAKLGSAEFGALLGLTAEDVDAMATEFERMRDRLFQSYPLLARIDAKSLPPCGKPVEWYSAAPSRLSVFAQDGPIRRVTTSPAKLMAEATGDIPDTSGFGDDEDESFAGPNKCKWVQFTVALAVCSASGPLYYPCAWLAFCSLCTGPIVDAACFQ
jgi:hypothetical protein